MEVKMSFIIRNEKQFAKWFKKNYKLLGFSKIVRGDISRCPDFVMVKDGKEVGVELETSSSNFLAHKHDIQKVDEVVCLINDAKLNIPTTVVKFPGVIYLGKRKVTLSIDHKTYSDFQRYCEENAIMLSKKIELFMKSIAKNKKIAAVFLGFVFLMFFATVCALQFSDLTQNDFNNGTYSSAIHNGTGVVLSNSNLSGNYASRIFDAGSAALWNNLTFAKSIPVKEYLYAADVAADVWNSTNSAVNWTLIKDDYNNGDANGAGMSFFNSSGAYYIIYNQKVYVSLNFGASWTKVNNDYNGAERQNADVANIDKNNNIYIIEGDQDVWKSSDSGTTWAKLAVNFNGGGRVAKGIAVNSSNILFSVDNSADFWSSSDGVNWTKVNDDYNGADGNAATAMTIDRNDVIYVLDSTAVWKSSDSGTTWAKQTNDFDSTDAHLGISMTSDSQNNLYIIDGGEDVYISSDSAATWTKLATNFNGATGNANAFSSFLKATNITLQIRNCSSSCTTEQFIGPDGTSNTYYNGNGNANINLTGRYFQYKVFLTSSEAGLSSILYNVNLNYSLLDNTPPIISIYSPATANYTANNLIINFTASDSSGISAMWFNNGTANQTYTDVISLTASQGSNTFIFYANDSLGNINSSSITFYIDSLAPAIAITSPISNANYSSSSLSLSFTAADANLQSCWRSIDNGINVSLPGCLGGVISGFIDGQRAITVYANDTLGNVNSSSIAFTVHTSPPAYSNPVAGAPSAYSSNLTYFNITWIDSFPISSVLLESNFSGISKNYTMQNIIDGIYQFSVVLPAGAFYWKSYANDSLGNLNSSTAQEITINKAQSQILLYINGTENNGAMVYGTTANVSAYESSTGDSDVSYALLRNGVEVSNPDTSVLSAGYYNYTFVSTEGQNYSAASLTRFLNVTKAIPNLQLTLNGASSSTAPYISQELIVNASSSNSNVKLYEDSSLIDEGNVVSAVRNYSSIGARTWKAETDENENYSSYSVSYDASVADSSYPMFSGLKSSIASSSAYSSANQYVFNATWTHSLGISEVIFTFNGVNYSYSSEAISKNGDEYFINIGNLPVKTYSYRWFANSTTGNSLMTSDYSYSVEKAIAALFLMFSPSNSITYGSSMSVICTSNNIESIPVLIRNAAAVSNPDAEIIPAGAYNYACTSIATENYSSASTTGSMAISKASPSLALTLNGASSDIFLSSSGETVAIKLSISTPANESINLSIDGVNILSGYGLLENSSFFSSPGEYIITGSFPGNENYSSASISRKAIVAASSPPNSGGGGGGGSSSSSESSTLVEVKRNPNISMQATGDLLMNPGESRTLQLIIKNNGDVFLNKCKISGIGQYSSWINSPDIKNINSGEITEFLVSIQIPFDAPSESAPAVKLECVEKSFDIPLSTTIINSDLVLKISKIELSNKQIEMDYEISGDSSSNQSIIMRVYDEENNLISEKEAIISPEEKEKHESLDVSSAKNGMLKVSIFKKGESTALVEEFFLYNGRGISGLAAFEKINATNASSIALIIFFIIMAIFSLKRIYRHIRINKGNPSPHQVHHAHQALAESKPGNHNHLSWLKRLVSSPKRSKDGVMVVDHHFINHLKEHAKGKDMSGKWISVNIDDIKSLGNK